MASALSAPRRSRRLLTWSRTEGPSPCMLDSSAMAARRRTRQLPGEIQVAPWEGQLRPRRARRTLPPQYEVRPSAPAERAAQLNSMPRSPRRCYPHRRGVQPRTLPEGHSPRHLLSCRRTEGHSPHVLASSTAAAHGNRLPGEIQRRLRRGETRSSSSLHCRGGRRSGRLPKVHIPPTERSPVGVVMVKQARRHPDVDGTPLPRVGAKTPPRGPPRTCPCISQPASAG